MKQCALCDAPTVRDAKFCSYVCEEDMERHTKRETLQKIKEQLNTCRMLSEYSGGDTVPFLQVKAAHDLTVLLAEAVLKILEEQIP